MKKVLSVSSSLFGDKGVSSELLAELLAGLQAKSSELQIIDRDFSQEAIPHLDGEWLTALMTAEQDRTESQIAKVSFSDMLIEEVKTADTFLIALPMYNFTVPSMLKSWIDHIARAGTTFKYTDEGPVGLLDGKRVYFLVAMGGFHADGETDFLRPYMNQIMNFLGITDVQFIAAEGLNMGEEYKARGMDKARTQIREILDQIEIEAMGEAA